MVINYMRESISITTSSVYEKKDRNSWLRIPRYTEVEQTSFLDARDLIMADDELKADTEGKTASVILRDAVNRLNRVNP